MPMESHDPRLILDPRVVAHMSHDQLARVGNMVRERQRRVEENRRRERLLIKSRATEKILYGIAFESISKGEAGFVYLHASNRNDAINQILTSRTLKEYRVVAVGPAIGSWSTDGKTAIIYA